MAQLAIKGHATRGREVIELLEMLGGRNSYMGAGNSENALYFTHNNLIRFWDNDDLDLSNFIIFTLEEFLEKFPYKVGDKVKFEYYPYTIQSMEWDSSKEEILYTVKGDDFCKWAYATDLQPYKEVTMEDYKVTGNRIDFSLTSKIELDLGNTHEVIVEGGKTYVVRKKPQYPRTCRECYKIFNRTPEDDGVYGYKGHLLEKFQELLICRDAYWKIAGEQMGLGKPWEPDYTEESYEQGCPIKYVIYYTGTHITKERKCTPSHILSFPTEEMRDAFYKNFKYLIESCKELL